MKKDKKEIKKEKVIQALLNGFSYREIKRKYKINLKDIRKIEKEEINKHHLFK